MSIAEALRSPAARRLAPPVWAAAEEKLAEQAASYRPAELAVFAHDLISVLDQNGPGERADEAEQVNELHLSMRTGKIKGWLDGLTREALATALDALCLPRGPEDERTAGQRRADALGEICARVLDSGQLPQCGGERPHLNVIIPLAELEQRARTASLDFGARLSAADLRMLAGDARVVPVVLGGAGQPLDVGRARRAIPDGLRRVIAARDRGCAKPGCGRPASWCEIHHLEAWEKGGETAVHNCVMLCRFHHRLLHRESGWQVHIRNGTRSSFHRNGSTKPKLPGENLHTLPRSMDKDDLRRTEPSPRGRPANDRLSSPTARSPVRVCRARGVRCAPTRHVRRSNLVEAVFFVGDAGRTVLSVLYHSSLLRFDTGIEGSQHSR
jgi:5-methylcytosine-specific restriction protein A